MQTFMVKAEDLDDKRLNKQVLEAYQIINILEGRTVRGAYVNHPAVTMWRGHEAALKAYFNDMLDYWKSGHNHKFVRYAVPDDYRQPPWISPYSDVLHTHKAMLYEKDPEHYKKFVNAYGLFKKYLWPTDVYMTYYKVQYSVEFEFGAPEDVIWEKETFDTRDECVTVIQRRLLDYYGHYYVDGNSRFSLLESPWYDDAFIRMQPIRFINYEERV